MSITIEEITRDHMETQELAFLTKQIPLDAILGANNNGHIARTIIRGSIPVGIIVLMNGENVMVAVHPDHQRCGIAMRALELMGAIVFDEMGLPGVKFTTLSERPSNKLAIKFGIEEISGVLGENSYEFTKDQWNVYKNDKSSFD